LLPESPARGRDVASAMICSLMTERGVFRVAELVDGLGDGVVVLERICSCGSSPLSRGLLPVG